MANDQLNKTAMRNEARQLLKEGTSKQETFEVLKEKYNVVKDLAEMLKTLPSKQAIDKYGKWNNVLLALLVLTTAIFLWTTPSPGILIWYGILIYAVAKRLVKYYVWLTVFSAILIISLIAVVFTNDTAATSWITIVVLLSLVIPTLVLPLWLEKKLCPEPTERKEVYTNSLGEERLKIVYEFAE